VKCGHDRPALLASLYFVVRAEGLARGTLSKSSRTLCRSLEVLWPFHHIRLVELLSCGTATSAPLRPVVARRPPTALACVPGTSLLWLDASGSYDDVCLRLQTNVDRRLEWTTKEGGWPMSASLIHPGYPPGPDPPQAAVVKRSKQLEQPCTLSVLRPGRGPYLRREADHRPPALRLWRRPGWPGGQAWKDLRALAATPVQTHQRKVGRHILNS
jgi:hypothetical protein